MKHTKKRDSDKIIDNSQQSNTLSTSSSSSSSPFVPVTKKPKHTQHNTHYDTDTHHDTNTCEEDSTLINTGNKHLTKLEKHHTRKVLADVDKDSTKTIMTFLDFKDLLSFTSTCSSLFQLSTLHPTLWKPFELKFNLINKQYNSMVAIQLPSSMKRLKYVSNLLLHDMTNIV